MSWSCLRQRIGGLLNRPPVYVQANDGRSWWLEPVLTTRIQNVPEVRACLVSSRPDAVNE